MGCLLCGSGIDATRATAALMESGAKARALHDAFALSRASQKFRQVLERALAALSIRRSPPPTTRIFLFDPFPLATLFRRRILCSQTPTFRSLQNFLRCYHTGD